MAEQGSGNDTARTGWRRRTGWWAIIPPVAVCLFDQAIVLWGQPKIYWSGHYDYAREASPAGLWLLQRNPIFFGAGMIGWILLFSTVILFVPRKLGLIFSMAVLLGHTWGSCSWLADRFSYGYWSCFVLLVLAAWVTVICWERLYRDRPRLVPEPVGGGSGQTGDAGPSRRAEPSRPDKSLFIVLAGLVLAEVVIAGQILAFHHVFGSRTGPLKEGIDRLIIASRDDPHPGFPYRLLRETGPLLHDRLVGQPWRQVLSEMEDQGVFWAYETGGLFKSPLVYHHLLAMKDAYVSPNGLRFDLELEFVVKVPEGMEGADRGDVIQVEAELVCRPNVNMRAEAAASEFPAGTFLGEVFATPEAKAATRSHPFLNRIRVSFGKVGRRAFRSDGIGYTSTVELWGDPSGTTGEGLTFQGYAKPHSQDENVDLDQLLMQATDLGNGADEPFYKGGTSWQP